MAIGDHFVLPCSMLGDDALLPVPVGLEGLLDQGAGQRRHAGDGAAAAGSGSGVGARVDDGAPEQVAARLREVAA